MTKNESKKLSPKEITAQISKNIKRLRIERGYTQKEMAEKLGIIRQGYVKIENGYNGYSVTTLLSLRNIFQVSINELIETKNE